MPNNLLCNVFRTFYLWDTSIPISCKSNPSLLYNGFLFLNVVQDKSYQQSDNSKSRFGIAYFIVQYVMQLTATSNFSLRRHIYIMPVSGAQCPLLSNVYLAWITVLPLLGDKQVALIEGQTACHCWGTNRLPLYWGTNRLPLLGDK